MSAWKEHVGVGKRNYALQRTGNTRQKRVIAEDGPRKGRVAAIETEHKDGRQDAKVIVDPVHRTINLTGGAQA